MCGGEGGCNKDEGGDKGGRGHKMLAMERVNVRWRRERGGQMLVVKSLYVKRVRGRKNQICAVELVHARRWTKRVGECMLVWDLQFTITTLVLTHCFQSWVIVDHKSQTTTLEKTRGYQNVLPQLQDLYHLPFLLQCRVTLQPLCTQSSNMA